MILLACAHKHFDGRFQGFRYRFTETLADAPGECLSPGSAFVCSPRAEISSFFFRLSQPFLPIPVAFQEQ